MNLPGDTVHSIDYGYGRLVLPVRGGWLFHPFETFIGKAKWFRIARTGTFHNCRATGVY